MSKAAGLKVELMTAHPDALEWIEDGKFRIGDLLFKDGGPHGLKTSLSEIIIRKSRSHIEFYKDLISNNAIKNVLEVGMYEAGSALCFASLFPDMRLSSVDLREPNPAAQTLAARFGDRLRLHYRTSQADAEALKRIHQSDFAGAPLDMVTDDASHFYDLTRSTFEICFPMLKPGGVYIIEDWAWAHWAGWQKNSPWPDKPALSNFIFELVMASATSPNTISKVECDISNVVVHKSEKAGFGRPIEIASLWAARGKSLTLI